MRVELAALGGSWPPPPVCTPSDAQDAFRVLTAQGRVPISFPTLETLSSEN